MSTERIDIVGEYLTRAEVAEMLKVSTRTVDRYIEDKKLTAVKLPGNRLVRIPQKSVDALLDGVAA